MLQVHTCAAEHACLAKDMNCVASSKFWSISLQRACRRLPLGCSPWLLELLPGWGLPAAVGWGKAGALAPGAAARHQLLSHTDMLQASSLQCCKGVCWKQVQLQRASRRLAAAALSCFRSRSHLADAARFAACRSRRPRQLARWPAACWPPAWLSGCGGRCWAWHCCWLPVQHSPASYCRSCCCCSCWCSWRDLR